METLLGRDTSGASSVQSNKGGNSLAYCSTGTGRCGWRWCFPRQSGGRRTAFHPQEGEPSGRWCLPLHHSPGESVDFVLFPEGYICATDNTRKRSLQRLASELNAPLLVGAIDKNLDASDRAWQVLLRFEPDESTPSRIYVKHSTAEAVAFERQDWEPCEALPTFDLRGVTAGATICHDHYLGLLPRFLVLLQGSVVEGGGLPTKGRLRSSVQLHQRASVRYVACLIHV